MKENGRQPYLPVRGREPLDGGGQALRGEPHRLRAELFVREDEAQHVERVHLGNVHALALAASHLAAADVLAVVVLRVGTFSVPLGARQYLVCKFFRASRRRRFRDDETKTEKRARVKKKKKPSRDDGSVLARVFVCSIQPTVILTDHQ